MKMILPSTLSGSGGRRACSLRLACLVCATPSFPSPPHVFFVVVIAVSLTTPAQRDVFLTEQMEILLAAMGGNLSKMRGLLEDEKVDVNWSDQVSSVLAHVGFIHLSLVLQHSIKLVFVVTLI
jgi:hypothetical protein